MVSFRVGGGRTSLSIQLSFSGNTDSINFVPLPVAI